MARSAGWLILMVLILGGGLQVFGQSLAPKFEDYRESRIYEGKVAAPNLQTRQERLFRTRIKGGSLIAPNFAGRYVLTTWGCGASCTTGVAVDARNGKVIWLPKDVSAQGAEFQLTSRLIIFDGGVADETHFYQHFYEIRNGRFVFVKTRKHAFLASQLVH